MPYHIYFLCHFLVTFAVSNFVFSYQSDLEVERELYNRVTQSLPQFSPPTDFYNKTLFVEFQLHQVLDVDEKNGLWYTKAAFYISYFSDSVVWHPAEYNNISQLKFTQSEKIWTSDLVILNAIDIRYITNPDVYIIYDGFVSLKSSLIAVKLSCGYDVTHFPFDEQTCYFIIGSLFNPLVLYNLVSFSTEAVLKFYIENDQWELLRPVRVYVKRHVTQYEEFYEKFEAEVRLRRRPLYYIIGSQTFPLS